VTGITQADVDSGMSWADAIVLVSEWLTSLKALSGENSYAWVTMGDYDLGTMIPKQCILSKTDVPHYWLAWVNFKETFATCYGLKALSPMEMMKELDITMTGKPNPNPFFFYYISLRLYAFVGKKHIDEILIRSLWKACNMEALMLVGM